MEVKHGVVVSLVNLYAETIGNPRRRRDSGKCAAASPAPEFGTRKALSLLARAIFIIAVVDYLRACHRVGDFRARDHAHAGPAPVSGTASTDRHSVPFVGR